MTASLVNGWYTVPLIEAATLQRGFDLPVQNRTPGEVPVFAANGPVGTHSEHKVKGPGVVTGRSGTIGKVHYVECDFWPLNTSLFVKEFHGNHPKFIFYLLNQLHLERFYEGTGVPTLNRNNIHSVQVPLPPLAEQKRIADILDKADAIRGKRAAGLDLLADIRSSAFLNLFGDPRNTRTEWPQVALSEVTILDAPMVDPKEEEHLDLIHIGPDRIEKNTGRLLPASTAREEGLISNKFLFDERYLLYSKIRPYLRKVALPSFRGLCSADVYPIRPIEGMATREFLFALLISEAFLAYTNSLASRASIPKLNRKELAKYTLRLPPMKLQEQYSSLLIEHERHTKTFVRAAEETNNLFNSLVQRAFKGEL